MLSYREDLKPKAQNLRKNMTPEEKHLWFDFLKAYPIQFRRQKPVNQYILDFYCSKAKLAIELDGSQHYETDAQKYDEKRTKFLEEQGIEVLRFTNQEIKQHFPEVVKLIEEKVKERVGKYRK
jgi:very-short-patch-repair endonuclease